MKKGIFVLAAVLYSGYAQAQNDSIKTLDQVIVTANKFPQKQSETGKVVDIITQDQLQKSFGKSLGEVLNQQPGLVINGADNNLGTNQTVYLEGASSANTLILLDGVPLYDPSGVTTEFDLNNFSLENIERIEILKGAQSTLYGSDAVAGVINLISKKGEKKPFNLNAGFSAGSYGTYKGSVSLSGTNGKDQSYFVSYNKLYSNGFSSAYDSTGKANFDKDGFNQDVFQLNYVYKPFAKTSVKVFGKYNNNHAAIDAGAFIDDKNYTYHNDNTIVGATIDYTLAKGFIRFQYNYNIFNRNFLDDTLPYPGTPTYQKGTYNGVSGFTELYTNLHLNKNLEFIAGMDYRQNNTRQNYFYFPNYGYTVPSISPDSAKTNQVSGYASLYLKTSSGFNIDLGGRWNHHSIYGDNFTYTFNPFLILNNHYKIYTNISSGYRVPSLYQLYSEYGNKSLKPEMTTSYEAGLQYFSTIFTARATGFVRNGKDIILFYTDPVSYASYYINGDKQHDFGVETEATVTITSKLSASANYTFVDGTLATEVVPGKDTSYFNLYKRPKSILNISINYNVTKKLGLSTHLKTVSKAFEPQYMGPPFQDNAYYVLDLLGRYRFSQKLSLFTDFQNITNQKYFVIRGFTTKGFNFNGGVQLSL